MTHPTTPPADVSKLAAEIDASPERVDPVNVPAAFEAWRISKGLPSPDASYAVRWALEGWQARSEAATAARDAEVPRWVGVDERLPPPFREVVVHPRPTDYCCEAEVNTQGQWSYGEYEHHFGHHQHKCTVRYWLDAPAAPAAGGAEG